MSYKNTEYISRYIQFNNIDLTHYEEIHDLAKTPNDKYSVYKAYWLNFKYNIKIPEALENKDIYKSFLNNSDMFEILTVDDEFVERDQFYRILDDLKCNKLKEVLENLTKDSANKRITYARRGYYTEHGRDWSWVCLETNNDIGILLRFSNDIDPNDSGYYSRHETTSVTILSKAEMNAFYK